MSETTTRAAPAPSVARRFRRLLANEGYRPRPSDEDGAATSLCFKVEGDEHVLRCCEDDPDFVQLCTGWSLDEVTRDELTLLRAANEVQAEVKVVKVRIPPGRAFVELQLELFLGGHALSGELLQRCLSTLRHASRRFYQLVAPEPPKAMA